MMPIHQRPATALTSAGGLLCEFAPTLFYTGEALRRPRGKPLKNSCVPFTTKKHTSRLWLLQ
ncbi:protein of unknown function [Aminobacter niigataensis]|nr:protein of unknown function [Aminobacter niigataensis]